MRRIEDRKAGHWIGHHRMVENLGKVARLMAVLVKGKGGKRRRSLKESPGDSSYLRESGAHSIKVK